MAFDEGIAGWTFAYNRTGKVYYIPISFKIERKIGFQGVATKKVDTIQQIAEKADGPLVLVTRSMFPELDDDGNCTISPTVYIQDFLLKTTDIFAATVAQDLLIERLKKCPF